MMSVRAGIFELDELPGSHSALDERRKALETKECGKALDLQEEAYPILFPKALG